MATVELSERENEVLICLVYGMSYQAIAARLDISAKTVETYRSRLVAKLGTKSRDALVRLGIERQVFPYKCLQCGYNHLGAMLPTQSDHENNQRIGNPVQSVLADGGVSGDQHPQQSG